MSGHRIPRTVLCVCLAITSWGGSAWASPDWTRVTVPQVVGMMQADAETAVTDAGLKVGVVTEWRSATVVPGKVLAQLPPAGMSILSGFSVLLLVAAAPPVAAPNVVGMDQTAAEAAIAAAGLTVGNIVQQASQTVPAGQVLGQLPQAGVKVAAQAPISLVVSNGAPDVLVLRVDAASQATAPDGLTWPTAYKDIQTAVDAALPGDSTEIWVAEGTYTAATNPVLTMKPGVSVYGGFAGAETSRDERDWTAHVTTIDGETVRCCVIGADNATLDGFTIIRGYTNSGGGGMSNNGSSPTVTNCVFTQNAVTLVSGANSGGGGGGAAGANGGGAADVNLAYAAGGGAMYNDGSSPIVTNCVFSQNSATLVSGVNEGSGGGGAAGASGGGPASVNMAYAAGGGAMCNNNSSAPTVTNCTFTLNLVSGVNSGGGGGGAAGGSGGGEASIDVAYAASAGAMCNNNSSPTVTNCILWDDTANAEIYNDDASLLTMTYSCIDGGYAGEGNIVSDPLFVDPVTNLELLLGSPCIGAGTASGAPPTNIQGIPWPNAAPDMGAY